MKTNLKAGIALVAGFGVWGYACSEDARGPSKSTAQAPQIEGTADAGTGGGAKPAQPGEMPAIPEVGPAPLRTTLPLMEGWKFIQDDDLSEEDALADSGQDWETVNLPHTWNAEDAASLQARAYKRGVGWYRLEFASPAAAGRHYLEIGAASLIAEVWLNGEKLGEHEGAFTAFRFDVTDELAESGSNVLFVKADNTEPEDDDDPTAIAPKLGDFNISGGLYRHVSLISAGDVHFDLDDLAGPGVYAASTLAAGSVVNSGEVRTGDATVNVRARVTNGSPADGEFVTRISLLDHDGQVAATVEQPVQLGAGETAEVTQDLEVAGARLWHGLADPYQYQLVAELLGPDGTAVDNVSQRFGIRETRFDAERGFFLNGEHVRLQGAAIHQDFLHKGWAVSNEDVDTTLALFTEIGANFIRLGHYPFSRYTLERVTELGLVAWPEAALGIRTSLQRCNQEPANERFVENAQQQLREMIRQQYNHAAIPLWSVGNESTQGQLNCEERFDNVTPVIEAMHEVAKEEDPTRPSAYAEFPHPAQRSGPFDTQNITDVFATNRYYLWYTQEFEQMRPLLDALHAQAPDQPLGISEYGGGSGLTHHTDNPLGGYPEVRSAPEGEVSYQPEEYASYLHEQNYELLSDVPYLWGTTVWTLVDFGSAHRNEGDVLGVNTKGLVSFDRQTKKDPFYFYKANWSSEPVTYITSRRYTDRAYPVTDVKVYSNADSVTLSVNGAPIGSMTRDQCEQRACVFEDVALSPGVNTISAEGDHGGKPVTDSVEWTMNATDINIAAGRLATGYVSSRGTRFGSDDFFEGGDWGYIEGNEEDPQGGAPEDVIRTNDPELYKYFRRGEFSYVIPLEDGSYELTLGFIEPDEDIEPGDRVFDVVANGEPLIEDLDIVAEAGGDREVITETFTVEVSGGRLVLDFTPVEGEEALVSTIKVVSSEEPLP